MDMRLTLSKAEVALLYRTLRDVARAKVEAGEPVEDLEYQVLGKLKVILNDLGRE